MNALCPIIVMAKAPLPGVAKTRLIPALGAAGAAALAERMLEHAVQQAVAAQLGPVELCVTPDATHPSFKRLAQLPRVSVALQGDGDLGLRMLRAFRRVLLPPFSRSLLIGADIPALDADLLQRAAQALNNVDAVFVPAFDGGYALVGLRRPEPRLFEGMAWSTPTVMARTRERLLAAHLSFVELAPVADIDVPADLRHLPARWRADWPADGSARTTNNASPNP